MSETQNLTKIAAKHRIPTITLKVTGRESEEFEVDHSFVGHIYISQGGDRSCAFVVGCDGDAVFLGNGGFLERVGNSNMDETTIKQVRSRFWKIVGLPSANTPVKVGVSGMIGP